jgi:hypothetical protein
MVLVCLLVCRGKPLREVNPGCTGRAWRRPSPSTDIKAAALRTLCQALVPDNHKANITQVWGWDCAALHCIARLYRPCQRPRAQPGGTQPGDILALKG